MMKSSVIFSLFGLFSLSIVTFSFAETESTVLLNLDTDFPGCEITDTCMTPSVLSIDI